MPHIWELLRPTHPGLHLTLSSPSVTWFLLWGWGWEQSVASGPLDALLGKGHTWGTMLRQASHSGPTRTFR